MSNLEHWQEIIRDWQSSGLSQKVFCQKHNLKIHTLHYWIRQIKKEAQSESRFISLTPIIEPKYSSPVELEIGHVRISTTLSDLGDLLSELNRVGLLYDPT